MHRKVGPLCCMIDAFEQHRGVHGHEARNHAHAKGDTLGRDCPLRVQLCTNCLSVVYVMKGMAELALCCIIWGSAQRHTHVWGMTTMKKKARHTVKGFTPLCPTWAAFDSDGLDVSSLRIPPEV